MEIDPGPASEVALLLRRSADGRQETRVAARAVTPHTPPGPGVTFARPTHLFGFIAAIICFAASRSIRTNDANCWPESSASAPSIVTSSPVW